MRTTIGFISELCTASLALPLWLKATLTVAQVTATCSVRQVKEVCTAAEEVWGIGYGNIDTNQFKDIYTIRNQAQPIHRLSAVRSALSVRWSHSALIPYGILAYLPYYKSLDLKVNGGGLEREDVAEKQFKQQ